MKNILLIFALLLSLPGLAQSHSNRLESVRRSNNQSVNNKSAFTGGTFELLKGNTTTEKRVDQVGKIMFRNVGGGTIRIKKIGRNLYEPAASQVLVTVVSGKKTKVLYKGLVTALEKGMAFKMPYKGSVILAITDAR